MGIRTGFDSSSASCAACGGPLAFDSNSCAHCGRITVAGVAPRRRQSAFQLDQANSTLIVTMWIWGLAAAVIGISSKPLYGLLADLPSVFIALYLSFSDEKTNRLQSAGKLILDVVVFTVFFLHAMATTPKPSLPIAPSAQPAAADARR